AVQNRRSWRVFPRALPSFPRPCSRLWSLRSMSKTWPAPLSAAAMHECPPNSGQSTRGRPRGLRVTRNTTMSEYVPDISVVLPAFNEAGNIAPMAAALDALLPPLGRYEIVFVDDGSSDGTLNAIRA